MSSELSPEVSRLISQQLSCGNYASQDELLLEAVRLLGERDSLRKAIDAGSEQLAASQYTDYDSTALRQRFDALKAGQRFQPKRES